MTSYTDSSKMFPPNLQRKFEFYDWGHATTILKYDYPAHFNEICLALDDFCLRKSHILTGGGGKSSISSMIDNHLYANGWLEKQFQVLLNIDGIEHDTPTHKVDCVKGRIALDVEWNNKTEFFDRDLNNFRLLHSLRAISLGVIVTRSSALQKKVFNPLGVGQKYGASTTHFDKLLPKIEGGGPGGCPLLVISIAAGCYDPNS
jgi:hypothetical protein